MTLEQAFAELIESVEFKEIAKLKNSLGGKYRTYLTRYRNGALKSGAIVELLEAHGYEIKANKVVRKKK